MALKLWTSEEFLELYDAGEEFEWNELAAMAYGEIGKIVCEEEGSEGRWTRSMSTVFEVKGRFFIIDWERGLTERQENEFYEQPYEVVKECHEKTIVVTNWIPVDRKE
jgi:hypothetical protein